MNTLNPATTWSDKRYLWLLSPAIPLISVLGLIGYQQTRQTWLLWLFPFVVHVLIPVLDWLFGEDFSNPPESVVAELDRDFFYRALLWLFIPFQMAGTVLGAWLVATHDFAWYELLGLIMSVGGFNGIGIATAHELGHKKESLDRWLGKLTLAPSGYGHFYVEHNRGHHKNVATPEDPATSRFGESFWAFWPRTVIGSLRSGWELEAERLKRFNKGVWSTDNENLQSWAMSVVLFGGLLIAFGVVVLPYLLIQAVYGFSLLEVVNYLEHYGLLRRKNPDGRYERCQPEHSWNSNHTVTNLFLYHLQRHSDHHANPTRKYQTLRHFDDSPQLPSGYAGMITLAYVSPLWFALMNKRVIRHYKGDLERIQFAPSKREALMKKYAAFAADVKAGRA